VQLAMDYKLLPMGTNAHKWYQLHSGLFGVRMANRMALESWQREFDTRLGIALTDTFTTNEFLNCFDRHMALLHDGVRQDSGDPFEFIEKIVAHYRSLSIDPMSKTILFSDSLNTDSVRLILDRCSGRIKCAFGIGTFFSNDILGVEPLRIVIKQTAVYLPGGRVVPTVKISDDPAKASGGIKALEHAKYELGIEG
jgi:nicotinate phosphoribosyltransferase